MLAQLVRPLVRTQIQLLAHTQSASAKLMGMISQWLGYLGVDAEVQRLQTRSGKIQVSLLVSKPEQCAESEWRQILSNISRSHGCDRTELTYAQMNSTQRSRVHRLLAYVLRVGSEGESLPSADTLQRQLVSIGLDPAMVAGIHAALSIPDRLEPLLQALEPEVAAFVLSRAMNIALMDQQINHGEDDALKGLYRVLREGSAYAVGASDSASVG